MIYFDKNTTLFLDRDGVINKRLPHRYVASWEEFEFNEGAVASIVKFDQFFKRIVVVTNQQGIGKKVMTEETLHGIHKKMLKTIEDAGGRIDKVYYCPGLALDHPKCRKPNTGMADQATLDFADIDLKNAVMVGDSVSDMGFGINCGMRTVFLEDNPDEVDKSWDYEIDFRFRDLKEFAKYIASKE